MNFFEKEMRSLFEANNLLTDMKFTGKTMIGKLDDKKLCKLQFVTTDTAKKYTAIQSSIISPNDGIIDKQLFKFVLNKTMKYNYAKMLAFYIMMRYSYNIT